jgi:Asp/Glu/hydantoin racemase
VHVHAITPLHLDDNEVERRRRRYVDLAPPGVTLTLQNLGSGDEIPRQLATAEDIAASEVAVLAAMREVDPATVDVLLPDCVLDPAVPTARDEVAVPVHGIAELAAGVVAALGLPFTAVARNRAIADELDRVLARYGHVNARPTHVLDLSFEAITDHEVWNDAVAGMTTQLASTPVRHVLNGCSAVEVRGGDTGVVVFDPTRLALETLGLAARNGLVAAGRDAQEVRA